MALMRLKIKVVIQSVFSNFYRNLFIKKRQCLAQHAGALEGRQALPDALTIGLADKTGVADHQDTAVAFIAYQASGSLFDARNAPRHAAPPVRDGQGDAR